MEREFVTKSDRFFCISTQPDICKTPIGPSSVPIPYTIKGEFADATGVSPDITSRREPMVIHASTVIPTVSGDEKGTAKGVKSGTVGARVQHDEKSSTVSFNGERAIRVGDTVFMNEKNTVGKVMERILPSCAKTSEDKSSGNGDHVAYNGVNAFSSSADQSATTQNSETILTTMLSYSTFIPHALLERVPGVLRLTEICQKLAQVTELQRKQVAATLMAKAKKATRKTRNTCIGIDGGRSRGISNPGSSNK